MTTLQFVNIKSLTKKLAKYNALVHKAVAEQVTLGTLKIAADAIKSIRNISPGSSPNKKNHPVSPPGEPPNTDTGRLIQSIFYKVEDGGLSGVAGTDLEYGKHLEFGTTYMDERPWLRPAFEANVQEIQDKISVAVAKAIKKGSQ